MIRIAEISAEEAWPLRQEVMWPEYPIDFVKLSNDQDGIHFGFFHEQQLVSVVSAFMDGDSCQFRKLATRIGSQGNGFASRLIERVIEYSQANQVRRLWCNARSDKTIFYKKFGLVETDSTFEKAGRRYVIMEKFL